MVAKSSRVVPLVLIAVAWGAPARAEVKLELGAQLTSTEGLEQLRTEKDIVVYASQRPPVEASGLTVTRTEVGVRAGTIVSLQVTVDIGAHCLGKLYDDLAKPLMKDPFPESFASDSACQLTMEAAPGRSADWCYAEALRGGGRRMTVMQLGADARGNQREVRRTVVEWVLDPSTAPADDRGHLKSRFEDALDDISDLDRRIRVASVLFDTVQERGKDKRDAVSAGLLVAVDNQVRAYHRAICSRQLGIFLYNGYVIRALAGKGKADETSVMGMAKALYATMEERWAPVQQRAEDLPARVHALYPGTSTPVP